MRVEEALVELRTKRCAALLLGGDRRAALGLLEQPVLDARGEAEPHLRRADVRRDLVRGEARGVSG